MRNPPHMYESRELRGIELLQLWRSAQLWRPGHIHNTMSSLGFCWWRLHLPDYVRDLPDYQASVGLTSGARLTYVILCSEWYWDLQPDSVNTKVVQAFSYRGTQILRPEPGMHALLSLLPKNNWCVSGFCLTGQWDSPETFGPGAGGRRYATRRTRDILVCMTVRNVN